MNLRISMRPFTRFTSIFLATIALLGASSLQAAPMQFYFNGAMATNGNPIGGFAITPDGNTIWSGSYGATGQIRKVTYNGSSWVPTINVVTQSSWANYVVADNTQTTANPNLNDYTTAQAFLGAMALNPAELTIAGQTYAPGTLMLMSQFSGNLKDVSNTRYPEYTKRFYWYNMTQTGQPLPATGSSTAPGTRTDYNGNNVSDWNDQFMTIATQQDFDTITGNTDPMTFTDQGRQWAFASNGQSLYINDNSDDYGGIYKVDLTQSGPNAIQHVLSVSAAPLSEMTVIPTSVRNFGFAGSGDQVLALGNAAMGNANGINAYLDDGTTFNSTPTTVFTEAQFKDFADWTGTTSFRSLATDGSGTVYAWETQSNMLFRYDSDGRFAKVVGEEERKSFLKSIGSPIGTSVLELKTRTNTTAHAFPLTEILYEDTNARTVMGILDYTTGDFDYDNDVDAADKAAFLAALRARGVANPGDTNHKFNLNGNSNGTSGTASATATPATIAAVPIASSIVDWKDVKILQTFLDFPDGDTNLDGLLDFTDLNTMRDNYYTLGGAADKTWAQGDFASLDPFATIYDAMASDANIVNEVDLQLLAHSWIDVLGQDNITWEDLDTYNYTGQFRLDVIDAFGLELAAVGAVPEPNACCLILLGAAFLARRSRSQRQALAV